MRFVKIREVFPGDKIEEKLTKSLGIHKNRAVVHGTLCRVSNHLFILSKTKRYSPSVDDLVLGRVVYVSTDFYRVDLGGCVGVLPSLSFTNASKRNKPEIKKDEYVFCRVEKKGVEPLLTCVGEGYGKVGGYVLPLDTYKCQLLFMTPKAGEIGRKYRFRMAVGLNGFVCIEGDSPQIVREIYSELNTIG